MKSLSCRAAIVAATALLSLPAHAAWKGSVSDFSDGIRQTVLIGKAAPDLEIMLTCTKAPSVPTDLNAAVILPSTGKFAIKPGDAAEAVVALGNQSWNWRLRVDENDSSSFAASGFIPRMIEIVTSLQESPAPMKVTIEAGAITESFEIGVDGIDPGASQFLDACEL